jgi:hypothetical protein
MADSVTTSCSPITSFVQLYNGSGSSSRCNRLAGGAASYFIMSTQADFSSRHWNAESETLATIQQNIKLHPHHWIPRRVKHSTNRKKEEIHWRADRGDRKAASDQTFCHPIKKRIGQRWDCVA